LLYQVVLAVVLELDVLLFSVNLHLACLRSQAQLSYIICVAWFRGGTRRLRISNIIHNRDVLLLLDEVEAGLLIDTHAW
jgi:ABC-type branched-subunit amino acid transport system ATPase component